CGAVSARPRAGTLRPSARPIANLAARWFLIAAAGCILGLDLAAGLFPIVLFASVQAALAFPDLVGADGDALFLVSHAVSSRDGEVSRLSFTSAASVPAAIPSHDRSRQKYSRARPASLTKAKGGRLDGLRARLADLPVNVGAAPHPLPGLL